MVSGAKTRWGSVLTTGLSTVQGLWETGADELLKLLEEEISDDILDQTEATKIQKKIRKNNKQALDEAKQTEYEEERIEKWQEVSKLT